MYKMSDQHKMAISKSLTGKKHNEERKQARSKMLKENHPRAFTWVLVDPNNTIYRTNNIADFCKLHSLSYSILRYKAQQNDGRPILRGPSKGWFVYGATKIAK